MVGEENSNTVFGLGEIREREVGKREFEEKNCIYPIWFKEKSKKNVGPTHFLFLFKVAKKKKRKWHYFQFDDFAHIFFIC
jgi:hypothetical protein